MVEFGVAKINIKENNTPHPEKLMQMEKGR